jgi:hypothetical protein
MQHTHHSHLFFTHSSNPHNSSINHQSSINQSSTHPHIQSSPSSLFSQLNFDSSPFALALSQIQSQSLTHTPHPPLTHSLTLSLVSPPKTRISTSRQPHSHSHITSPSHHPHITLCSSSPITSFLAFPLHLSISLLQHKPFLLHSTSPHSYTHTPSQPFAPLTHSPHLALASFPPILCATMPSPPVSVLSLPTRHSHHTHSHSLSKTTPLLFASLCLQLSSPLIFSLSLSLPPPHLGLTLLAKSRPPLLPQTSPLSSLSRPPLSLHSVRPIRRQSPPYTSHTSPHE